MTAGGTRRQFCTFRLGELYFGIAVLAVQEVLYNPAVTLVPTADPAVEGLVNLRGRIATAVDLRRRLELPTRDESVQPVHVVVASGNDTVTLMVDQIGDVLTVGLDDYEPAPPTVTGPAKELVLGAYKLTDELLLVLDVAKTIDLETSLKTGRDRAVGDVDDQPYAPA